MLFAYRDSLKDKLDVGLNLAVPDGNRAKFTLISLLAANKRSVWLQVLLRRDTCRAYLSSTQSPCVRACR